MSNLFQQLHGLLFIQAVFFASNKLAGQIMQET
jgi:hypothetical protein